MRPLRLLLGLLFYCLAAVYTADAAPPAPRVVSLAPNLTEIVFALGHGDDVVGVTDFCRFPPEAATRTKVGGLFDVNSELVLALRPTTVLLTPSHEKLSQALKQSGINTVSIKTETTDQIFDAIRRVGTALQDEPAATRLIDETRRALDRVRAQAASAKPPAVLFVVGYAPDGMRDIYAVGSGTFLNELIAIAGGRNVMEGAAVPYPLVPREYLIANPPDVLIDCSGDGALGRSDEDRKRLTAGWQALFGAQQSRLPRIVYLDDPHVTIPGPSIARTAEQLRAIIHPPAPAAP